MTLRSSERGSIFFYILLGIILFSALSYAFSRSSRGVKDISSEKTVLMASEILAQGNTMKEAVAKLRLKGVTDIQLSFENSSITGYTNSNCAVNDCKIFQPGDGGAVFPTAPPDSQTTATNWGFSGRKDVMYAGTTAGTSSSSDLVAVLPNLTQTVCEQINLKLNIPSIFTNGGTTLDKFVGTYGAVAGTMSNGTFSTSGCVKYSSLAGTAATGATAPTYAYIQMLLAR